MASPIFAGLTILMLGDSHFAAPGLLVTTLQNQLIAQGAQVRTYAACGTPAGIWIAGGKAYCGAAERVQSGPVKRSFNEKGIVPSLSTLIGTVQPNLIIIGFGDSMADYTHAFLPVLYLAQQVGALTSALRATHLPCVWIGPGWGTEGGPSLKTFARAHDLNAYLAGHVAPCRYIDTQSLTKPGEWATYDGTHYMLPGYQKWAKLIDSELLRLAQTPP